VAVPPPSRRVFPQTFGDAAALMMRPVRSLLGVVIGDEPPIELQLVGRIVFQAIVVGLTVGAAGCVLLLGLDAVEHAMLNELARYPHLHAAGESLVSVTGVSPRLYLLPLVPMVGALIAGWISRRAPEIRGGGGDAMIEAFHHRGGKIRRRVILFKSIASLATLGFGGAGGREGPTMQIGGAVGAWVSTLLPTTERERRILMIAGVAAGLSAVFRTPLGAALLAIEVLYRDDFESEALIPAVLASVIAYSLASTFLSTAPMFGELPRFSFQWEHLPFYAVAALVVAAAAAMFVELLRIVQAAARRLPGPEWARPAVGGLALGVLALAAYLVLPGWLDVPAAHVPVLGGGYGASQVAITGDPVVGAGMRAAVVLLVCALLRAVGAALTIGTGGSAGDFAPSLAIGALVGGAIGHVIGSWFGVSGISPGAFALVGMATFYGGVAKTPLAATVMICEMSGSYDLLVPLMLSQAIAFVALRRVALYPAQVPSQRHSPAHAAAWVRHQLVKLHAGELIARDRPVVVLHPAAPADDVLRALADAPAQPVFPVVDDAGTLVGLITGSGTREIAAAEDASWAVAADLMVPPVSVPVTAPLPEIARLLFTADLRAVPVVDEDGRIVGLVDEHDVSRAYLGASDDASRHSAEMRAVEPP
jgi:CIC family chloride channel protein